MRGLLTKTQRQKQVIARLKNENQNLRNRVKELEKENGYLRQEVETLKIQVEELTRIIFGVKNNNRKGKRNQDNRGDEVLRNTVKRSKRTAASYQRPLPSEDEVTDEEVYAIDYCDVCGDELEKKEEVIRYIEDVWIGILDQLKHRTKRVIKQIIERGYCMACKKWRSKIPISKQTVLLGENVRMIVGYGIHVLNLGWDQVKNLLNDLYMINVSDGEIGLMLEKTSDRLEIEYERMLARIRGSTSVHLDETGWRTGSEKNYAWVMASGESEEAIFGVGKNRGKGNAEDFLGEGYGGVRVTDCYGAYKNLAGAHQVCWVHILRKARDLSNSERLSKEKRIMCEEVYHDLACIYVSTQNMLEKAYKRLSTRKTKGKELARKVDVVIGKIRSYKKAPKKLQKLGIQLETYREELFTCVFHEGVAADNNKAERKLRKLVLKRKNSFGTKTDKGNRIFSINASVLLSLWWDDRSQFFPNLKQLLKSA
jgi:transposase